MSLTRKRTCWREGVFLEEIEWWKYNNAGFYPEGYQLGGSLFDGVGIHGETQTVSTDGTGNTLHTTSEPPRRRGVRPLDESKVRRHHARRDTVVAIDDVSGIRHNADGTFYCTHMYDFPATVSAIHGSRCSEVHLPEEVLARLPARHAYPAFMANYAAISGCPTVPSVFRHHQETQGADGSLEFDAGLWLLEMRTLLNSPVQAHREEAERYLSMPQRYRNWMDAAWERRSRSSPLERRFAPPHPVSGVARPHFDKVREGRFNERSE